MPPGLGVSRMPRPRPSCRQIGGEESAGNLEPQIHENL